MWAAVAKGTGMSPGRVPKVPAARAQITLCGTTGWPGARGLHG